MGGIGSAIGSAIGTAILPGVGTAVGGALGGALGDRINKKKGKEESNPMEKVDGNALSMGMGAAQMLAGKRQQKKADNLMPAMENPEERAMQNYFKRRKRAYQTGTANYTQGRQMAAMMKSGMEKSMTSAGGTKGLNMMSKMYQNAMMGMASQNQQGELQYAGLEQKATEKLADRRLQLQLLNYNTKQARAAEQIKGGRANMNAGLAGMMGNEDQVAAVGDQGGYGDPSSGGGVNANNKSTT